MTTIHLQLPDGSLLSGRLDRLPNGRATTPATLARMWGAMKDAQSVMAVYAAARQLTRHLSQKDYRGEARVLFEFVRDRIRYVRDPYNLEALQTPEATLNLKTGDCDDKTILLGALLRTIGVPVVLVAGGFQRDRYQHVWLRAQISGRWVPMDPTEPRPMGWEAPLLEKLVASDPAGRSLSELAGKRVKKFLRAQAAAVVAAQAAAATPAATAEQKRRAEQLLSEQAATHASYAAKQATKVRGFKRLVSKAEAIHKKINPLQSKIINRANKVLPRLIQKSPMFKVLPKKQQAKIQRMVTAAPLIPGGWDDLKRRVKVQQMETMRLLSRVDPGSKIHYQHLQRQTEMKKLNQELRALQVQMEVAPTIQHAARVNQILARLGMLAGKEKHYNKNGFIAATIASIILTVITFGAGAPAWQAFVQAVGKGTAAAVKLAADALLSVIKQTTHISAQQYGQMQYALNSIIANPPPSNLTRPTDILNYSLAQQAEKENAHGTSGLQLVRTTAMQPMASRPSTATPTSSSGTPVAMSRADLFPWAAGAIVLLKLFI